MTDGSLSAAWTMLIWLAAIFPAFAAFERQALNPINIGLGRSGVAHGGALDSEQLNPAAHEPTHWASFAYDQPFQIAGLSESRVRVGLVPLARVALRFAWQRFGNELHSEDAASFASRIGGERFSAGIRGTYFARRTEGFAGANAYGVDLGVFWRASSIAAFGASARHLGAGRFIERPEYRIGSRVEMGERSAFLADMYRVGSETGIAVGGEWRPYPNLTLRVGTHNQPWQWAGGFSLRAANLLFHYAVETHAALDATHSVGLTLHAR